MRPVVAPDTMRGLDASAPDPLNILIERAGWLVADRARSLMGGAYGRRVVVLCGPGNNGGDGRVAARWLEHWGSRCLCVDWTGCEPAEPSFEGVDLVVDASFGTGFRGEYRPPTVPPEVPVLAVDIPSGVDGLTGAIGGAALTAAATVTFAAVKPGLLLHPGSTTTGRLEVVDVGVPVPDEAVDGWWFEEADLRLWPRRRADAHKWRSAVWTVGGTGTMSGALALAASAAQRAGAGYVRASTPGQPAPTSVSVEVVAHGLSADGWAEEILAAQARFGALVVGPGLADVSADDIRVLAAGWEGPIVLDAGALGSLAGAAEVLRERSVPAVLTPHDGELRRLDVDSSSADRVTMVRSTAAEFGAVLLAKGPTTIVGAPDGRVGYVTGGALTEHDARLATAGTGDVLAGVVGAALAGGLEPWLGTCLGAQLHAEAARHGRAAGLVAGDLPLLVAEVLSEVVSDQGSLGQGSV